MKYLTLFITICFIAVMALSITVLDSSGIANAQTFTNDSLKGKYALKAIYGDDEGAGIGIMNADGNGNASGNYVLNGPGFITMRRNRLTATVDGTYNVNTNGTLTINWLITLSDPNIILEETGDCVIMQADDTKLAKEVFCFGNEPLTLLRGVKRGGIITMTLSRLPD
jgi:hypothetical protein